VDNDHTLHISIVLAICLPKNYQIWCRFDEVLTKTSWVIFLAHPVFILISDVNNLQCFLTLSK